MSPGASAQPREHAAVAIYDTHAGAASAVLALREAGFDMGRLSIAGQDLPGQAPPPGAVDAPGGRLKAWSGRGAVWGTLGGMLAGGAFFAVPALGPLVVLGPLAAWCLTALEGAAVGGAAGALAAALAGHGVPAPLAARYRQEVKAGRFLVLVHGAAGLIEQARHQRAATGAAQVAAHVNHGVTGVRGLLPGRSESTRLDDLRAGASARDARLLAGAGAVAAPVDAGPGR